MSLHDELEDLSSAEEFLDYFAVPYAREVVQVYRLHILQRFHDYLSGMAAPADAAEERARYRQLLAKAYDDFVGSDAATERVFKVFRMGQASVARVPVSSIVRGERR